MTITSVVDMLGSFCMVLLAFEFSLAFKQLNRIEKKLNESLNKED